VNIYLAELTSGDNIFSAAAKSREAVSKALDHGIRAYCEVAGEDPAALLRMVRDGEYHVRIMEAGRLYRNGWEVTRPGAKRGRRPLFTAAKVAEIQRMYAAGRSIPEIAHKFAVSLPTVRKAVEGRLRTREENSAVR
jgi:hypothetical protein